MDRLVSEQAALDAVKKHYRARDNDLLELIAFDIERLPSAQPEGWVKIPDTGIDDLSDGFHTFRQLYYQRMMLFATIVRQNREKAWKSLRHEDGELCFGGGWFIVGIDTPKGSYTYHYENKYFDLFDCEILDYSKHWDGHTEKDVTRLLSLPDVPDINDGDTISRQAAIDEMRGEGCDINSDCLRTENEELKSHIEYMSRQAEEMRGEIKALAFAVRCNGVSGNEVRYE